jgi:RNA polymerase sigma factor (TIGR02999 family)
MNRSPSDPLTGAPSPPTSAPPSSGRTLTGLVPLVYRELRAIAHRQLGAPDRGMTMSTTALVNEAYLKLAGSAERSWNDRTHFLALAAIAMRQILIDRARARVALKRGGGAAHVTLDEGALASDDAPEALLALDQALERLSELAPRLARVVELRFYGGLSEQEVADVLGVTTRTVQRDWVKARMLLRRALEAE